MGVYIYDGWATSCRMDGQDDWLVPSSGHILVFELVGNLDETSHTVHCGLYDFSKYKTTPILMPEINNQS
jgi:hypothetical protein